MKRYFFDVTHGQTRMRDGEGSEHPNIDAVRAEAQDAVRELAADFIRKGEKIDDDYMEVRDDAGAVVLTLHFRDVIV